LFAQKQTFSWQRRGTTPDSGEETPTVTDDRAQVPNNTGKSGEDREHQSSHPNLVISDADRIFA
jgi:hypothetical protein